MKKTLLATTAAIAIGASVAFAQSSTDQIINDLQSQGFEYIEIKQGPTQIKVEAVRGTTKLEVIYDAATGAILKQEIETADAEYLGRTGVEFDNEDEDFLDDEDLLDDEEDDEEYDDEEDDDEEYDDEEYDDEEDDDEEDDDEEDDDEEDDDEEDDDEEDDE